MFFIFPQPFSLSNHKFFWFFETTVFLVFLNKMIFFESIRRMVLVIVHEPLIRTLHNPWYFFNPLDYLLLCLVLNPLLYNVVPSGLSFWMVNLESISFPILNLFYNKDQLIIFNQWVIVYIWYLNFVLIGSIKVLREIVKLCQLRFYTKKIGEIIFYDEYC